MSTDLSIDDHDPRITYTPVGAWQQQFICSDCRGVEASGDTANITTSVRDAAANGTWTTALGNVPSSNVTFNFQGTTVTGLFMLFTRVQGISNEDLPAENIAQLAFYLNGTRRVDPSPIQFDYWWYPDFTQEMFVKNLVMLAQEDLGPWDHTLTAEYTVDLSQGRAPQVVFAVDKFEYTPVGGSAPNPPPSTTRPTSFPSSITSTSSSGGGRPTGSDSDGSGGGESSDPSPKVLGLSIGLSVFGTILIAILVGFFWRRQSRYRREDRTLDSDRAASMTMSPTTPYSAKSNGSSPPYSGGATLITPFNPYDPHWQDRHSESGSPANSGEFNARYNQGYGNSPPATGSRPLDSPPAQGARYLEKSGLGSAGGGRPGTSGSGSRSGHTSPNIRPANLASSNSPRLSPASPLSQPLPPPVPEKGARDRVRLLVPANPNANVSDEEISGVVTDRRTMRSERTRRSGGRRGNRETYDPSTRPPSYTSDPE